MFKYISCLVLLSISNLYSQDLGFLSNTIKVLVENNSITSKILLIVLSIAIIVYIFKKLKIPLKFPTFKNNAISALTLKINELEDRFNSFRQDVTLYFTHREEVKNEISATKDQCHKEINRETSILLRKALTAFDTWFNGAVLISKRENESSLCGTCKNISFTALKENIEYELSEELFTAYERNGFLMLDDNEFKNYVENLHSTFRNIIRTSVLRFYIHPLEFDKFFSMSPADKDFERMMSDIYDVLYELFMIVRNKEMKMFNKITEMKKEYNEQLNLSHSSESLKMLYL